MAKLAWSITPPPPQPDSWQLGNHAWESATGHAWKRGRIGCCSSKARAAIGSSTITNGRLLLKLVKMGPYFLADSWQSVVELLVYSVAVTCCTDDLDGYQTPMIRAERQLASTWWAYAAPMRCSLGISPMNQLGVGPAAS